MYKVNYKHRTPKGRIESHVSHYYTKIGCIIATYLLKQDKSNTEFKISREK